MDAAELKTARWVAACGAAGGLAAWAAAKFVLGGDAEAGDDLAFEAGRLVTHVGLGAGAGIIGVYLLANSDRRQMLQCLAFALACGFSGRPIWEAGAALVEQQRSERVSRNVEDLASSLRKQADVVRAAPPETLEAELERGADLRRELLAGVGDSRSMLDWRRGDAAMQEFARVTVTRVEVAPDAVVAAVESARADAATFGRSPDDVGATQALFALDRVAAPDPAEDEGGRRPPEWKIRTREAIDSSPALQTLPTERLLLRDPRRTRPVDDGR